MEMKSDQEPIELDIRFWFEAVSILLLLGECPNSSWLPFGIATSTFFVQLPAKENSEIF